MLGSTSNATLSESRLQTVDDISANYARGVRYRRELDNVHNGSKHLQCYFQTGLQVAVSPAGRPPVVYAIFFPIVWGNYSGSGAQLPMIRQLMVA